MNRLVAVAGLVALSLAPVAQAAGTWEPFIIRTGANATPLSITGNTDGSSVTTLIDEGSEKTGYGTELFNGQSISTVGTVSYTRVDAGNKTPYVNIWVTDGLNYAVVAPNVYSSYGPGGAPITPNVNGLEIQSLGVNIYETNTASLGWLAPGAVYNAAFQGLATYDAGTQQYTPVTVGDLYDSLTVFANTAFGGTGAPKAGNGLNLVFGDTQGNFQQSTAYQLENVSVTAVPEPAALGLVAVAGLAVLRRRR